MCLNPGADPGPNTGGDNALHGDLLPLPLVPAPSGQFVGSSLAARSRAIRQAREREDVNLAISTINDLGRRDWRELTARSSPSEAQSASVVRIQKAVGRLGPKPMHLTPAKALSGLCKAGAYGEAPSRSLYGTAEVSLPAEGSRPKPLPDLLGPGGGKLVHDWIRTQILPPEVAADNL